MTARRPSPERITKAIDAAQTAQELLADEACVDIDVAVVKRAIQVALADMALDTAPVGEPSEADQIKAAFEAHIKGLGRTPLKVDVMENIGKDWPAVLGFRAGQDDDGTEPIIVSDNVSGLSLEFGTAREIAEALVAASNIMPVLHERLAELEACLRNAGRAIASLDDGALGLIYDSDPQTGDQVPVGSVRDALVSEITDLVGPLKSSARSIGGVGAADPTPQEGSER